MCLSPSLALPPTPPFLPHPLLPSLMQEWEPSEPHGRLDGFLVPGRASLGQVAAHVDEGEEEVVARGELCRQLHFHLVVEVWRGAVVEDTGGRRGDEEWLSWAAADNLGQYGLG